MPMATRHTACLALGSVLLIVGVGISLSAADVVVVVSAKNPIANLARDEISDIFLGKTTHFRNGGRAVPVDQVEGSSVRGEFYDTVAAKSAAQLKAYWSKMIFTGRGQPPKELANGDEVKQFIASHADAIGYIDSSALDGTIKALTVSR